MTKTKHKILSVFLSFCMIISCMVGMSVTAGAEDITYTVKIGNDTVEVQGNEVSGWVYRQSFDDLDGTMSASVEVSNTQVFSGYSYFGNDGSLNLPIFGTGTATVTYSYTSTSNEQVNGSFTATVAIKGAHDHSFTYSASGATITATCSAADCTLTNSQTTLTIAAPALTTYGGTGSAEATITDTNSIQGTATVSYYKANNAGTAKTGSALTSAPTDAGKYWAEITLGTGNNTATAHVAYTIAKADPSYTVPTGLTATYGQTLADVTLHDGWAWADSTQSVGNVVSPAAAFKAKFTPDDTTNYNTVENIDVKQVLYQTQ